MRGLRAEVLLPATTAPSRPVQQPTGPALCGGQFSGRPNAPPASLCSRELIYSDPDLTRAAYVSSRTKAAHNKT
jgi:hypothetical protein